MNYHDIEHDTMLQGEGLRVALFVAGCDKIPKCKNCQNKIAWDKNSGIYFDTAAWCEIKKQLDKPYIQGLTLLGGEPLAIYNREEVTNIAKSVKQLYPEKDIWTYTGYNFEQVKDLKIMEFIDVLVDGEFIEELKDENYKWAGSTNQRIIDVQKSLKENKVILYAT